MNRPLRTPPPRPASDAPYPNPPVRWSDVGQAALFVLASPLLVVYGVVLVVVDVVETNAWHWRS